MIEYLDDANIGDEEDLYRRVKLRVDLITFDPDSNRLRPTSTAFKNSVIGQHRVETYMSVFISSMMVALELNPELALEDTEDFVLVKLSAGAVREKGRVRNSHQQIFPQPVEPPPPCMQAHGGVAGNKTKRIRRDLSDLAEWIVKPPLEWVADHRETLRIPQELVLEDDYESLFA